MFPKNDSGFDKTYIVYFYLISIVHILKISTLKFVFSQERMDMTIKGKEDIKQIKVVWNYTYQTPF